MAYINASFDQIDSLNAFIRAAKGVWGYDENFLDTFIDKWGLTDAFLQHNTLHVWCPKGSHTPEAIYGFDATQEDWVELKHFYVHPQFLRQGLGQMMWQDAIYDAITAGWSAFHCIADPNAEPFYLAMGAKTVQQFESYPGRFVPMMKVDLSLVNELREVKHYDIDVINSLIKTSRAHWGYTEEENQQFIERFGVTMNFLRDQHCFIVEHQGELIAMTGVSSTSAALDPNTPYFDYLFVKPDSIRHGIGQKLWQYVCSWSRRQGWSQLQCITNPYARDFCLRMGATIVGDYGDPENGMKTMTIDLLPH